jgi:hypothetical protein
MAARAKEDQGQKMGIHYSKSRLTIEKRANPQPKNIRDFGRKLNLCPLLLLSPRTHHTSLFSGLKASFNSAAATHTTYVIIFFQAPPTFVH